jgi:hypothetical protein
VGRIVLFLFGTRFLKMASRVPDYFVGALRRIYSAGVA